MDTAQKANRNQRFLADEAFQDAITEVRQAQITAFENSGSAGVAIREEAHAILRALTKIISALEAPAKDLKVEEKQKERHRGSDRTK